MEEVLPFGGESSTEVKSRAENAPQQGGKSFPGGHSARRDAVSELPRKSEENKLAEASSRESELTHLHQTLILKGSIVILDNGCSQFNS